MKVKKFTLIFLFSLILLCGAAMLLGRSEMSLSERRALTGWDDVAKSSIASGEFMTKAEDAAMDQFPFRDQFRRLKASFLYHAMGQLDNNGIYIHHGNAGRLDYPLNEPSVNYAIEKIKSIQNTYLRGKNTKVYYCIIPDKNYYFANELGYPVMDYEKMAQLMEKKLNMQSIDISDLLEADSYYHTDPHWNQANIIPVAQRLVEEMNGTFNLEGVTLKTEGNLTGAYFGQSALPLTPDPLEYWDGGILDGAYAYDATNKQKVPIYNKEGAASNDPYNFFLGGAAPLQVIENPNCTTGRELVIFRDSFGSSIAPLLAGSYSRITLVDTRYVHSSLLKNYIRFQNQDVLFLYSALILNQSSTLK